MILFHRIKHIVAKKEGRKAAKLYKVLASAHFEKYKNRYEWLG